MLNSLSNININRTSSTASGYAKDNDTNISPSEVINDSNFTQYASITDEEAEQMLPGYAIAFEGYHLHRAEGDTPEEALQKTLTDWRKFWAANAYVPHRRQS